MKALIFPEFGEKIAIKERFEKNWFPRLIDCKVRPIIDHVFPLEQAADAHKYMEASEHFGKIILTVTPAQR